MGTVDLCRDVPPLVLKPEFAEAVDWADWGARLRSNPRGEQAGVIGGLRLLRQICAAQLQARGSYRSAARPATPPRPAASPAAPRKAPRPAGDVRAEATPNFMVAGKNIQTLKEEEKENENRNAASNAPDPGVQRRMANLTKLRTTYQDAFCTDRTQPRQSALNFPTVGLDISRYLSLETCESIEMWKQKQPRSERLMKQMLSALRLIASAVRFYMRQEAQTVSRMDQEDVVWRPRVPVAKISKANLYKSQIPFGSTTALADAKAPNGAVRASHRISDSAPVSEAQSGAVPASYRDPESARSSEVIETDEKHDLLFVNPSPRPARGLYWGHVPYKTVEQGFSTIGVQAGDDAEIRTKPRARARPASAPASRPPSSELSASDRSAVRAWMDRAGPADAAPVEVTDFSPRKNRPSSARSLHSASTASSLARGLPPRPASAGSACSDAFPDRSLHRTEPQAIATLPPRPATASSVRSDVSVAVNVGHRSEAHAGTMLPPRPSSAKSARSDSSVLVRIGRATEARASAESDEGGVLPRRPSTADLVARNRALEEEIAQLREEKLKQDSEVPRNQPEESEAGDARPATSTVQLGCFPATAFWGTEYQEEFNVLGKGMNLRIPGRKSASGSDASALSVDALPLTSSERKLVRSSSARSRPSTPI